MESHADAEKRESNAMYSPTCTQAGRPRQRQAGGGNKPRLATAADKLLFILVCRKTYLLQTAHGLQFGLSQSQTKEWIHRWWPPLERSLARLTQLPERNPQAFATSRVMPGVPTDLMIAGTDRLTAAKPMTRKLVKDTGFPGYERAGVLTLRSRQKPKGKDLSLADLFFNHLISGILIRVEHVIASLKRCRIVSISDNVYCHVARRSSRSRAPTR